MVRWLSLLTYGVIFAIGVGGGAGLGRWLFPPPTRSIAFQVQTAYFKSSHSIEGLIAKFTERTNGMADVELIADLEPGFSIKALANGVHSFTLPDSPAAIDRLRSRYPDQSQVAVQLANPDSFGAIRIDFALLASRRKNFHVIQLREGEYRILPLKAMPDRHLFSASDSGGEEQGYVVISIGKYGRYSTR